MYGRATTDADGRSSSDQPSLTGGEFLLGLVRNPNQSSQSQSHHLLLPHQHHQSPNSNPNHLPLDPAVAAVAAVGPPLPPPHFTDQFGDFPPFPPNFFLHGVPSHHYLQQQQQQSRLPPGFGVTGNRFDGENNHQKQNEFYHQKHNQLNHEKKKQEDGDRMYMFGTVPYHVPNEGTLLRNEIVDREVSSSSERNLDGFQRFGIGDRDLGTGGLSRERTGRLVGYGGPEMRSGNYASGTGDRMKRFEQNVGRDVLSSRFDAREPRELGVRDPIQGNRSMQRAGFDPSPGGKASGRNKGFEHNVGGELYRNGYNVPSRTDFSNNTNRNHAKESRFVDGDRDGHSSIRGSGESVLASQLHLRGVPGRSRLHSESATSVDESSLDRHVEVDNGDGTRHLILDRLQDNDHVNGRGEDDIDDLSDRLADSTLAEDESNGKQSVKKNHFRDKDFRSDTRGRQILSQRMRRLRGSTECRGDIGRFNSPFLLIYESLVPPEEEKAKQKQLLASLKKLVNKEWPHAKLYLYGSCANSFGVSKSDIDVCLAIDDQGINKSEILLRLAEILESANLQDVQALTRARVPIVKLKDPETGISCDLCINNVLAVVNTKLLRDYAAIDVRLRQLAFIVKHWAKSRGVNETYQGTLSSYAYVLMCIHFLQRRRPAILPCLQALPATYSATADEVECTFFDQVEKLRDFGVHNREGIAQLVWGFFNYWAYHHDYADSVISVRLGSILSKQMKDWTRRVGNDRHLICIEDPFETSHDLGRVVDKHSIRVLREEFERAAEIMQYDPNPCITLFQPYVPS